MMKNIDVTKKIEAFLNGTLKGEELKDFQKELENNNELKKLVELQKDIHISVSKHGKTKLRNELNDFYKQHAAKTKSGKTIKMVTTFLAVAASLLLFYFVLIKNDSIESEQKVLSLDSASINQPNNYADSALFSTDSANAEKK